MSYSVYSYGSMMGDSVRMNAYIQALRTVINPETIVLDLGAGTGIFSMLACRFGARKVYAIEPNDAIEVAKQLASDNECSDRIQFIQEMSTRVTLPEPVDVIVSDLRGTLPVFSLHIPSIVDARSRFLKPDGVLLPQKDKLWVAVAETPELYDRETAPWKKNHFGFNLQAAQSIFTNSWGAAKAKTEQVMTEPESWATLDYRYIEDPNVKGEVDLEVIRPGIGHGLFIWFDATISDGISFSGGPGAPEEMVYGNGFFPFSKPVNLVEGDRLRIAISASLVVDTYIWQWRTHICRKDNRHQRSVGFTQSTFFGDVLSPSTLHKRASSFVPALNEDGRIEKSILDLIAQRLPLGNIADRLMKDFPKRFTKRAEALAYVGTRSQKYSI